MRLTADERPLYAEACWETFRETFDIPRLMASNVEGNLISKWISRNLPLAFVLQGIKQTGGKPRTLLACERAVEEEVSRVAGGVTGLFEADQHEEL